MKIRIVINSFLCANNVDLTHVYNKDEKLLNWSESTERKYGVVSYTEIFKHHWGNWNSNSIDYYVDTFFRLERLLTRM